MDIKSSIKQLLFVIFCSLFVWVIWEYKLIFSYFLVDKEEQKETEVLAIPVDTKLPRIGDIISSIKLIGTVVATESISLTTEVPGIVEKIYFLESSKVKKNDTLIKLNTEELEAELFKWKVILENRKRLFDIGKKLSINKNIAPTKLDELATNYEEAKAEIKIVEAKLRKKTIRAPFTGIIGITKISIGSYIEAGESITTLDAINPIELEINIPETSIEYIKKNIPIVGNTRVYKNTQFTGIIKTIGSRIDPESRSLKVLASFPNKNLLLKPGMFMLIDFPLEKRKDSIIIPEEAVVTKGKNLKVYSLDNGIIKSHRITIGERLKGEVEILSGLSGKENIIVGGIQKIREGQNAFQR